MKILRFTSLSALTVLFGCGSVPKPHSDYLVSVRDIVNNISCELQTAAKGVPFIEKSPNGWLAGVDMTLQVINEAGATADANLGVPLMPQALLVTASSTHSGKADRQSTFSFNVDLGHPDKIQCDRAAAEALHGRRLRGNLGIQSWLTNMDSTIASTGIKPDKVGYVLEFTIVDSGTGGPAISLIPVGESVLGSGLSLTASRNDVQTMTIAYTENSPPTKPPSGEKPKRSGPTPQDKAKNDQYLNNLITRGNVIQKF
ncbi:hypothetical protein C8D77_12538 [Mesorhizobium loti]|uniref:Lipoprotein n=1 Tax=Rhizobium loti TaxID=381 RepID=A0A8E3B122_RHILI|nr:hypothetical protein C8D77_12538 [Mesorhizobium loti]